MQFVEDPGAYTAAQVDQIDDARTFELAPVSLWLEDLSALKALFIEWSQEGTISVRDHLVDNPDCLAACHLAIRVLKVNRKTLRLYEANDFAHLVDNFERILGSETMAATIDSMMSLWEGKLEFFTKTVNSTLTGRRLDIQLRGNILPGYEQSWGRVLIAVEDVTDLQAARQEIARSEAYARGLFEHSPVSLWVKDFSGVRHRFDELRASGVHDLHAYTEIHPDFIGRCTDAIRVVDVNHQTLKLFGIMDKDTFWRCHVDLLRINLDLQAELFGLWNGELFQERETINYKLDGEEIHVHLQFSVLPGHEKDWSLIQVARIDVTGRERAEAHLRYLQDHDSLTRLHSRSFYNNAIRHLIDARTHLITVIVVDLDGLKAANDQGGHAHGDEMLRRAGDILSAAVSPPWLAARIGGDEFVILMSGADEIEGSRLMAQIQADVHEANRTGPGSLLSLSLGAATRQPGESLETTVNRADGHMYEAKRLHYNTQSQSDRRSRCGQIAPNASSQGDGEAAA